VAVHSLRLAAALSSGKGLAVRYLLLSLALVTGAAVGQEKDLPEPPAVATSAAASSPAAPVGPMLAGCAVMGDKCICVDEGGRVVPPVPSMCRKGAPINLHAFFPLAGPRVYLDDSFRIHVPPARTREVTRLGRFLME